MKFLNEQDYPTAYDAAEAYPQYEFIEEVEGGWMIFATATEWEIWLNQA